VNSLKMVLIGLTILSAQHRQGTVAQVAEDARTSMRGVHEIQVTLRKYEFSPGSLRVRKGEQVSLIMTAVDHDHGFKLDDFDINQKVPKGTTVVVKFTLTRPALSNFAARMSVG